MKELSFKETLKAAKNNGINPLRLLIAYVADISLDDDTPDEEFEERCKKAYKNISDSLDDITGMVIPEDKR